MSELIRKLKEKKYITKIKVRDDLSGPQIVKEISQTGSVKIVKDVKKSFCAVIRETNAPLMDIMYKAGLAANKDYMTYEEAANVCDDDLNTGSGYGTSIFYKYKDFSNPLTSFDEFQYFTGIENIKDYTFFECYELTSIAIPDSVTSIGGWAFNNCSGLTIATISNSVTSIGDYAFSNCRSLESIVVESGNSAYDSRDNCNAIIETDTNTLIVGCKNTIIPNSITTISDYAFQNCSGLTSIVIPNSVTYIGMGAFGSCVDLTSITIPNSVTSIGDYVFTGCDGLGSIVVENGNTVYDSRDNCNAIIETDTNTLIFGCKNTIIPNSVTTIGNQAFRSCVDLTSIVIPNSVTSIGDSAFRNCRGLTSITIGTSVTSIGEWTFEWCISLSSITCLATTAPITCDSFGYSTSNCVGRNTYDQGINKLKVPTGATGYDTDEWLNPLQNPNRCGFTIEYI